MVTRPPRTLPWPSTVNGSAPRPSSSISTPRPRSPRRTSCIGRVRACGSPSKITGPSASAATGGTNRITVPARPQSTVAAPRIGPGVTFQSSPSVSTAAAQGGEGLRHQLRVPGTQRTSYDARPVGQRGQHQGAVRQGLGAGQGDGRADGPEAWGAGQRSVVFCSLIAPSVSLAARPRRRVSRRWTCGQGVPGPWPPCAGAWPRASRCRPRAWPARRRPACPRCRRRRAAGHRASRRS